MRVEKWKERVQKPDGAGHGSHVRLRVGQGATIECKYVTEKQRLLTRFAVSVMSEKKAFEEENKLLWGKHNVLIRQTIGIVHKLRIDHLHKSSEYRREEEKRLTNHDLKDALLQAAVGDDEDETPKTQVLRRRISSITNSGIMRVHLSQVYREGSDAANGTDATHQLTTRSPLPNNQLRGPVEPTPQQTDSKVHRKITNLFSNLSPPTQLEPESQAAVRSVRDALGRKVIEGLPSQDTDVTIEERDRIIRAALVSSSAAQEWSSIDGLLKRQSSSHISLTAASASKALQSEDGVQMKGAADACLEGHAMSHDGALQHGATSLHLPHPPSPHAQNKPSHNSHLLHQVAERNMSPAKRRNSTYSGAIAQGMSTILSGQGARLAHRRSSAVLTWTNQEGPSSSHLDRTRPEEGGLGDVDPPVRATWIRTEGGMSAVHSMSGTTPVNSMMRKLMQSWEIPGEEDGTSNQASRQESPLSPRSRMAESPRSPVVHNRTIMSARNASTATTRPTPAAVSSSRPMSPAGKEALHGFKGLGNLGSPRPCEKNVVTMQKNNVSQQASMDHGRTHKVTEPEPSTSSVRYEPSSKLGSNKTQLVMMPNALPTSQQLSTSSALSSDPTPFIASHKAVMAPSRMATSAMPNSPLSSAGNASVIKSIVDQRRRRAVSYSVMQPSAVHRHLAALTSGSDDFSTARL
ncbi:hypothetical protein CEUSTIGMA_g7669.t1 [Chlamydomonas eustigma]|uniref:Uncharacterized protein n=1 Tax=Chlamydomonas eustigma TaxID=1157962 RepID=A0A250XAW9_9CHLO|nr:hypothetical protein CEUSTIGMA_g7669.t1 [Chlamydomonas eustigma]|eukprot:GAX80231.1 hypothetical protein CEUSTIGMA_g7669.t1 [Chlamydomonas eustigma]